ncbi:DNA-directed RNA polymerase subunit alpha [Candidatus Hodgkinia cicadicola]|uniref:DNA-directed RNA polymerase subunit alpha n=1 Tax=Candidatus Hodgkinia cicadicola TaxID=573658 RepID=A0ABX4MHY5_9HYPH|nr:DNA-directed RNA polymerase subunit alpha [Candidatus Hodgkinia cicadicola]
MQQISLMPIGHNRFGLNITLVNKSLTQTIGNALRRALVANVEGYTVIGIGIDGFYNELGRIDGVKEDVIEVINNIKQLRFVCQDGRRVFKLIISSSKVGGFFARDIHLPNGVLIINCNQYICGLRGGVRLRVELVVGCGRGYLTASEVQDRYNQYLDSCLALDVDFNPIKKVSFRIIKQDFNTYSHGGMELAIESNGSVDIVGTILRCCTILIRDLNSIKKALRGYYG